MKRIILVLLIVTMLPLPGFGAQSAETDTGDMENRYPDLLPEEYNPEEYPDWLLKTRRATVVFAGSYPLSVFFTKLGLDMYDYASHGFSSDYSPAIMGGGSKTDYSRNEIKRVALTALVVSGVVTAIDFIIQEIKENRKEKGTR